MTICYCLNKIILLINPNLHTQLNWKKNCGELQDSQLLLCIMFDNMFAGWCKTTVCSDWPSTDVNNAYKNADDSRLLTKLLWNTNVASLVPIHSRLTLKALKYFRINRGDQRVYFNLKTILDVLVSSFWFIRIPMLWVYGHYTHVYSYSAGINFIRQHLMSTTIVDTCAVRVKCEKYYYFCKPKREL